MEARPWFQLRKLLGDVQSTQERTENDKLGQKIGKNIGKEIEK